MVPQYTELNFVLLKGRDLYIYHKELGTITIGRKKEPGHSEDKMFSEVSPCFRYYIVPTDIPGL